MNGLDGLIDELAATRRERGITHAELGARIGFSKSIIGHWEARRCRPSMPALAAWAGALGYEIGLYEPPQPVAETSELLNEVIRLVAAACGVTPEAVQEAAEQERRRREVA